jgi:hypothetical protein
LGLTVKLPFANLQFATSPLHDHGYYQNSIVYEFVVATNSTLKIAAGILFFF